MNFGLSAEILDWLRAVFVRYPDIDRVLIFGSRARGNYRNASDIDLAVLAPRMDDASFTRLWSELDDLPLVFTLDVLDWGRLPAVRIRATLSMMAGRFSGYRSSSGFPTCDTGRLPILDGITFLRL